VAHTPTAKGSVEQPCSSVAALVLRCLFAYIVVVPNVCACRVSYTDTTGVTHTACVAAGSLYKAAALGVAEFQKCGFMDTEPGPGGTN
jgi:hypothetical protein